MTELNQRQAEFAQALYQSYVTNVALNEDDWQGVVQDFETAYAVQERVMTLKGQPTAGYKVSLTSEETQKNVSQTFLTAVETILGFCTGQIGRAHV